MNKSTTLIYQHIPKTGGSSLKKVIESQYKERQLLKIYDIENREVNKNKDWYINYYNNINFFKKYFTRCIMGHSAGGFIEADDRFNRAFTLFRHPVDRVLSLYYYGLSLPDDTEYKFARAIKDNNLSLPDIFEKFAENMTTDSFDPYSAFNEFFNGQIRAILRPRRHLLKWFDLSPVERDRRLEDEAVNSALEILRRYYVVGFQEKFRESIDLFCSEFGWKKNLYYRVNITPERKSVSDIPQDLKSIIEKYNSLDIRIYKILLNEFNNNLKVTQTS